MKKLRDYLTKHFEIKGLEHCFIFAALGGIFLILSGIFIDPSFGRVLTGLMIALRGSISEWSRRALAKKHFSEPASAMPGMLFATLINLPAFLTAQTPLESMAFGIATLVMFLKFLQYLPSGYREVAAHYSTKFISLDRLIENLEKINLCWLNSLNKQSVFGVLIAFSIYSIDVFQRVDIAGAMACTCLLYSGLSLALKTSTELADTHLKA